MKRSEMRQMGVRLPKTLVMAAKKKSKQTDGSLDKYVERLLRTDVSRTKTTTRSNSKTI